MHFDFLYNFQQLNLSMLSFYISMWFVFFHLGHRAMDLDESKISMICMISSSDFILGRFVLTILFFIVNFSCSFCNFFLHEVGIDLKLFYCRVYHYLFIVNVVISYLLSWSCMCHLVMFGTVNFFEILNVLKVLKIWWDITK